MIAEAGAAVAPAVASAAPTAAVLAVGFALLGIACVLQAVLVAGVRGTAVELPGAVEER